MDQLPYLERVKIQSEILLPFYRRIREELGELRAAELLKEAVGEYGKNLGEQVANSAEGSSLEKLKTLLPVMNAGDALEIEPIADSKDEFSMNIRGCQYAKFFESLGESKFGSMLTCDMDFPLTEGIGDDISLHRTQTIMKGGSHCDFRWRTKSD